MYCSKKLLLAATMLTAGLALSASAQKANYAAAEKYRQPKLSGITGSLKVIPFFFKHSDAFWFQFEDSIGRHYYIVDPARPGKRFVYDRQNVAAKLGELLKEKIDTQVLNCSIDFSEDGQYVEVSYKSHPYDYYFYEQRIIPAATKKAKQPVKRWPDGLPSPDGRWELTARKHNAYLKRAGETGETALSKDGACYYSFGMNEADTGSYTGRPDNAGWLGGSKWFYCCRKDRRRIATLSVMNSLVQPRPWIETYKYEMPGDKEVTQYEVFIGDTTIHGMYKVNTDKWPDQQLTIVNGGLRNSLLYFTREKRTRDEIELCSVDPATGQVQVLIHETSRPFINEDLFNVAVINEGRDIIWWSDRTGWGQYYLYGADGQLKHPITQGSWTAGKILAIDTLHRQLYLYGYGHEPGRNPNLSHVYKTGIDDQHLSLLTPENAHHEVFISKHGHYLVDNFSRIDLEPETVLRDSQGKLISRVAKAELSRLYRTGWKAPEPFVIMAKDGVTPLYGLLWKPFDFDSTRKYPVVSQVYPGPQTETVWPDFTVIDRYDNTALAQLGIIVVCMGHRGGSPYRNKAYHTFGYGDLRDYALEDDKYGLEQLAARYPFIDIARVGIYGHSGGGAMAVSALCTYPDFYKVAVASSGNHDNRIYNHNWGETYQGLQEETDSAHLRQGTHFQFKTDINQSLAGDLKGHLLLVTGESDQNVHPAHTYRLADALIQAGKDFDMLVLPGQSHGYEGADMEFFQRKKRAFFARWLIEQ